MISAQPRSSRNRPGPNFRATALFSAHSHSFPAQPRNSRNRPAPEFSATGTKFPRDRAAFPHSRTVSPSSRAVFPAQSRNFPAQPRSFFTHPHSSPEKPSNSRNRPVPNFSATGTKFPRDRAVFRTAAHLSRATAQFPEPTGA